MLNIRYSSQFKKDYKLAQRRHFPLDELFALIDLLRREIPLPEKFRDHELTGNWAGFRECHIRPDWLLIYRVQKDILELVLARTGTHSDLFRK